MSVPNAGTKFKVERYDSPLRFLVASATRPGIKHLVELDSYRNNGECSCEQFKYRCRVELEAGAEPSAALRCNHILIAREYCLDEILTGIAKHRKDAARQREAAIAGGYDPDPE